MEETEVYNAILSALSALIVNRPVERSPKARVYSVAITDMEKIAAYFKTYAVEASG